VIHGIVMGALHLHLPSEEMTQGYAGCEVCHTALETAIAPVNLGADLLLGRHQRPLRHHHDGRPVLNRGERNVGRCYSQMFTNASPSAPHAPGPP
jgi:hypothetical protein